MMLDPRRPIVDLLPQFLQCRRAGWNFASVIGTDFARPAFFLLQAITRETDPGDRLTFDQLNADLFNPFSTFRPVLDYVPALVERGMLARDGECYTVTAQGRELVDQVEVAARAFLATRQPAPLDELARLADTLEPIAARLWAAPEPAAKPHQARVWRNLPPANSPPLVRLEQAIFALWTARDDAHNAAWRAAGLNGPVFDLLTHVWNGSAKSIMQLTETLKGNQHADNVQHGVDQLVADGDLARNGDYLTLTERGQGRRDLIEAETDRIYFAPWPELAADRIRWIEQALRRVVAGLE